VEKIRIEYFLLSPLIQVEVIRVLPAILAEVHDGKAVSLARWNNMIYAIGIIIGAFAGGGLGYLGKCKSGG
jgi:hypothetical protein